MTEVIRGAITNRDVRTRLLDGAEECFRRYGISQTTMDDIVRAARVPRTTAYRHGGSKDALIAAVVMREATKFLKRLSVRLASIADVEDAVVEGVLLSIDECRDNELIAAAWGIEVLADVRAFTRQHQEQMFRSFVTFMGPLLDPARRRGRLRPDVTDEDITEWAIRTILSFAFMGQLQHRDREEQRDFLRRMLVPAFCLTG